MCDRAFPFRDVEILYSRHSGDERGLIGGEGGGRRVPTGFKPQAVMSTFIPEQWDVNEPLKEGTVYCGERKSLQVLSKREEASRCRGGRKEESVAGGCP